MSALVLALHVLDAYDNVPGYEAALKALLPHHELSSAPALLVVSVLSVACAQERFVPVKVTPITVTSAQEHAGAVGGTLYHCVVKATPSTRRSFGPVWEQIRNARREVGDRGVCVQAAAYLACKAGDTWEHVDRYLELHPLETCGSLIAAADLSRDVRKSAAEQRDEFAAFVADLQKALPTPDPTAKKGGGR